MKLIKMYAWEQPFARAIGRARSQEMNEIKNLLHIKAMIYILLGCQVSAEPIFITIMIFNNLSYTYLGIIPITFGYLAEVWVSCKRFQELTEPTIKQISMNAKSGDLVVVIGPVGAGKTTFLMSLLNELSITGGSVATNGSIGYVSQESWVFNARFRFPSLQRQHYCRRKRSPFEMFGKQYNEKRFREVIAVCALDKDLDSLPFRDNTIVGERGVLLSGGQKARVALARALYSDEDIYLLDDPLSAVDTEVANHIFEKCVCDYLRSKTVVLITHQIQFIQKATKILVLNKDGVSLGFGSYEELLEVDIDFMSLTKPEVKEQFIPEDYSAKGSVNMRVYWYYMRAGAGPLLLLAIILSAIVSQTITSYSDIYVSQWTKNETNINATEGYIASQMNGIIIYSSIIILIFVTLVVRCLTFFRFAVNASTNLHNTIFSRLMTAPIAFFDINPIGIFVNTFQ
ncbi:unnamed protein product [Medioppia subpectinata]|uniref:Uncharacterized protein n=1 Tax=Medioppia subpectinata TaxID=1979941 RepID=A0A7R9KXF0_9ACAR|nr:unnamed protein product [Medioppia subpectinata]CAG2111625.1 unnamed protein product [Medioppia subpectinata]